jgi:hypothetical protein
LHGHAVVAGDINSYVISDLKVWMDTKAGKRAVIHFDYKMKLRYQMLNQHVSKEEFFGNEGSLFATDVVFIGVSEPIVMHLTNNDINKENWLSSLACVQATVAKVKQMRPDVEEVAFVFDQGSHLYNNDVVQFIPGVCARYGVRAKEVVFGKQANVKGSATCKWG